MWACPANIAMSRRNPDHRANCLSHPRPSIPSLGMKALRSRAIISLMTTTLASLALAATAVLQPTAVAAPGTGGHIALEGAVNVRDLGGYRTYDGATVKSGKAIRADALAGLTDRDVATLGGRNLKSVVDLRTPGEVQFMRSEEHTSELQSRENLVCRLLLEKKKPSMTSVWDGELLTKSTRSAHRSWWAYSYGRDASYRDLPSFPTRRSSDLIRADALAGLTDRDVATLGGRNLKSVVDLRTPGEVQFM